MTLGPLNAPSPPTNPPRELLAPPFPFPVAVVLEKVPSPAPVKPPARLTAPTVTLPPAEDERIVAWLLSPSPTRQVLQLLLSGPLLPVNPPALLWSPAWTAPVPA